MTISARELYEDRKQRVKALLEEGLSTRTIEDRTGVHQRQVLRIKKQLKEQKQSQERTS